MSDVFYDLSTKASRKRHYKKQILNEILRLLYPGFEAESVWKPAGLSPENQDLWDAAVRELRQEMERRTQ